MHDVAVIGGGPVGSQTAYRLSLAGYRVIVLEKKSRIGGPVCCTGIVSQDCIQAFGIDDKIILHRLNSACLHAPGGSMLHLWRPEVQACVVDRGTLDSFFAERALKAGAEYRFDCEVKVIDISPDNVHITVAIGGEKLDFISRSVVITPGYGAKITTRPEYGKIDDFTLGVQAEVAADDINEVEVYFSRHYTSGFFAWLVPVSSGKALAGTMSRCNGPAHLKQLLDFLADRKVIKSASVSIGVRPIPLRPLAKNFGHRCIVAGSAAGQVKPITGGGIYYGLLCADIAAQTLQQALSSDDLSEKQLSAYSRECRQRLGEEIRTGSRAQRLFERLNDHHVDKIFELAGSTGIVDSLLQNHDLTFDWHGKVIKTVLREKALSGIWQLLSSPLSLVNNKN